MKRSSFFWLVAGLCMVYLMLAFKNPFANKSLIPNLEPGPDTFLYIVPVWNWISGNGFKMAAFGKEVSDTVPATYGLYLAPFLKFFGDIRAFYFGNLVLAFGTIVFFSLTIRELFRKNIIVLFLGILLVTNFYFFNEPVLLMAEIMNYFLISLFFYLMVRKLTGKTILMSIGVIVVTGLVKSTDAAMAGLFSAILALKILTQYLWPKKKLRKYIWWLGGGVLVLAAVIFRLKMGIFNSSAFNIKYFPTNWAFYWNSLTGGPTRNLWYFEKSQTIDIFILSITGLAAGLWQKKYRFITVSIWLLIVTFVAAMSVFRDTEARHVVVLLPLFLISAGIFLNFLNEKTGKWFLIILAGLMALNLYLPYEPVGKTPKLISLKQQVGLNFRHKEDPWNYLCMQEFNQYFSKKDDDRYFGSFLSIFYFQIFGNHNVNYLPITQDQDFMPRGLSQYFQDPLRNEYLSLLNNNKKVYYSDYYASNGREPWRKDLEAIVTGLKVTKVYQSPMDNCNIYQLNKIK